jgi:AAA family ATP:ADP antiporter
VHKILKRVKLEEWYAVILSFFYFFSVLSSYYVLRPLRDQLAAEVGSVKLPLFFTITFIATLILTPLFSWVVSKWSRHIILPLIYLFFIGCQIAFIPLFLDQSLISLSHLGLIFFVWVSVFNLFVVSVFWSFMTDIWSDEQARRLFPIIALGGTAGAVVGPFITRYLVQDIGLPFLLVISASLLGLAVVCIILLGRWAHEFSVNRFKSDNEAPLGGGMWDGLKQLFGNYFITNMSIMMLLADAIGTIAYVFVTDYSGMAFPKDAIARTRFAAGMDLAANIIQVVLQLTITRWLLIRFGAGSIFAVTSTVVVLASLCIAFIPNAFVPLIGIFPAVALLLILTRALSHGMIQPARETLYTLVPRDLRYKGKNAVDTVVWRAGDVASLISVNALKAIGVTISGFGILWAIFAAASGYIGWNLSNQVEKGEFEK